MAFPQRLLNEGEEIRIDVRPRAWGLIVPGTVSVILIVALILVDASSAPTYLIWILLAVLVVALGWLLGRYLKWRSTSLVVTNFRIIRRSGVLSRSGREIPLNHVADTSYRKTIFDRLVSAGDLIIESAGRDSDEVFADLPHPEQIQNEINRLLSQQEHPVTRRGNGGGSFSLSDELEHLDELRHRGVLTDREFEQQKQRLLNRP